MPFTHTWDNSVPLDTQAASLGAQDIRTLTLNANERIAAFGAGLLADRPTPETTSGTVDWTGVMYWATDTGQVFRWGGGAWADITNSVGIFPRQPTIGGVFVTPAAASTVPLWKAPYACTVVSVKGIRANGTSASINAVHDGVGDLLAADLSLVTNNTWIDGGAVQNAAIASGDSISLSLRAEVGPPDSVTIQVTLSRP